LSKQESGDGTGSGRDPDRKYGGENYRRGRINPGIIEGGGSSLMNSKY
jgi:hypothetical protein